MSQTRSEVSVYRTIHDIRGYRYLKNLIFDLYTHYLETNGGLPLFIPGYYLGKLTESIVLDVIEGDGTDATLYFERLTGMTPDELRERADAGQQLDLDSFFEEEMDFVVTEQFREQQDWFVTDTLTILEDERITCFPTTEEDEVARESLQLQAYAGELTRFHPSGTRALNPYKGGGFSCLN